MSIDHVASRVIVGTQQTYTFNDVPLGDAADDRYIFVTARGTRGNRTLTVSNIAVAGAATTEVVQAASGVACVAIRRTTAPLAAGTTGTIIVTFSDASGSAGCHIDVYRATRLVSTSPHDTANPTTTTANTVTAVLDVPASGVVLAAAMGIRSANNSYLGSGASAFFAASQASLNVTPTHSADGIAWTGLTKESEEQYYIGATGVNYMYCAAASFQVVTASDGAAAGSSTALGAGRSEARGEGAVAAIATAAASGRSEARGSGAAEAAALATGAGRSVARASGAAAGSATALANSNVPAGYAAGSATALATGRAEVRSQGTATGAAAVHGRAAMRGTAEGAATALAAGRSIARAEGEAAGSSTALATPPPAGQAAGSSTALAVGRSEVRAAGMAEAGAIATAQGRDVRRFFVTADEAGAFALDHEGLVPPGGYVARARASRDGVTTGWSRSVTFEVGE